MTKYYISLLALAILLNSCIDHFQPKAIRIGNQVWMSENLSADHFRNGDEIPQAETKDEWIILASEGKPAWCYPMFNAGNEKGFGKLYNWQAVSDPRGLAPKGWHVPDDEEWKQLTDYLGGEVMAAYQLRTTGLGNYQQNESGFSGTAGGGCRGNGDCFDFGSNAYWWTSTGASKENAWMRQLNYTRCAVNSLPFPKEAGLSVRCLKDQK